MAVTAAGLIKISEIALEFQDTVPYRLSKYYRGGALVPNSSQNANVPTSGAIKLSNFYGAVRRVALTQTFATNTTQTAIGISTLPGYVAGITDITITVNNGVYLYSTDVSSPALTITGATAGDTILLVNNGFILGMGGTGGSGSQVAQVTAATAGGPAMSLSYNISLTNNSYIAGGGGGGGGGTGGGGAGGGRGGDLYTGPGDLAAAGGAGGGPGAAGSNGGIAPSVSGGGQSTNAGSGAGGGRLLPGTGGAGSIGLGDGLNNAQTAAQGGGAGGGASATQGLVGAGTLATNVGGGGGGWGASGGSGRRQVTGPELGSPTPGSGGSSNSAGSNGSIAGAGSPTISAGGAGGKAINLNGFTITYVVTGTVYGAVS